MVQAGEKNVNMGDSGVENRTAALVLDQSGGCLRCVARASVSKSLQLLVENECVFEIVGDVEPTVAEFVS